MQYAILVGYFVISQQEGPKFSSRTCLPVCGLHIFFVLVNLSLIIIKLPQQAKKFREQ